MTVQLLATHALNEMGNPSNNWEDCVEALKGFREDLLDLYERSDYVFYGTVPAFALRVSHTLKETHSSHQWFHVLDMFLKEQLLI